MKRKLIIALLTLTLVVTMMPLSVFAVTAQNTVSTSVQVSNGVRHFQDLTKTQLMATSIPIDIVYGTYCYSIGEKYIDSKDNRENALKIINSLSKEDVVNFASYVPDYAVENSDELKAALSEGYFLFIDQDGYPYQWDVQNRILFTFGTFEVNLSPNITDYIKPNTVVFQPNTTSVEMKKNASTIKDYYFLTYDAPQMTSDTQKTLANSGANIHVRSESVSVLGTYAKANKTTLLVDVPEIEALATELGGGALVAIIVFVIAFAGLGLLAMLLTKRQYK